MSLSEKQRKYLRTLGHQLKPVVMIGANGLTDAVYKEFEQSIEHHEVMKIRVSVGERDARDAIIQDICDKSGAELVQRVGHIALLFKPQPKNSKIALPRR